MRPAWVVLAFLGCSGGPSRPPPADPTAPALGHLADDDLFKPTYGKPELQRALIAERGAEATGERLIAELEAGAASDDRLRVAIADLAIRRRFIASLEACERSGQACPPRLDDPSWAFDPDPDGGPQAPKLDAPLRFDLESWQKIAAELHGRACACRTIACVDSMGVAIDQLETRPMPEVDGDEVASQSITRARECLFRLRGKKAMPGLQPPVEE
jgi:hypothetical protein